MIRRRVCMKIVTKQIKKGYEYYAISGTHLGPDGEEDVMKTIAIVLKGEETIGRHNRTTVLPYCQKCFWSEMCTCTSPDNWTVAASVNEYGVLRTMHVEKELALANAETEAVRAELISLRARLRSIANS